MDRTNQIVQQGIPVTGLDAAHANEYFEQFVNASSMKHILGYYRGLIDNLHLKPNVFNLFYPKLRANLTSWRAKALLKKLDSRASHKCYQKAKIGAGTRVLVIGGGPCGMRTAIEAQLLGAKVVVVEKRDRFSRNNVLHLWPFVIEDLRMLGAKKFFGKFCAGAIDHISIRQLQCILLKVALLLGIEIYTEVSFEDVIEPDPNQKIGWRAKFKPSNHPVSQYEYDVIIGADGKRNTLQGFSRKEFRGKLAIAITANFINKKTEAEARVEEISGVAFIFNQKFFKDLQEATRIDLENIVYYKDDTHYFVMTAKKHSLIEKGVIKQDFADTERLLAPENVDKEALQQYAIEAASFSTNYQMSNLEFAVNHYGQPDIAMFDFTSMYAAENASKVVERNGYRLLKILVGDSLLEPFWPTGSGCARGFLSALDAAWAIRTWALGLASPLEVMAERESIYRLLAQTTPDNLNKDWKSYTLDPATRYPNLNKAVVLPHQVISLFDTDNPQSIERMKRTSNERPKEIPKKRRRGNLDNEVLLNWLTEQLKDKENIHITDMGSIFKDGKVLCAIIHHYRPDLLEFSAIENDDPAQNNQIAIDILEKDLGIPPVMIGSELTVTEDYLTMASYLTEIYDCFRGEIPHVKHPKLKSHLKNAKTLSPARLPCPNTFRSPNMKKPRCIKCFNAFHSKIQLYPKEIREKILSLNQSIISGNNSSSKLANDHGVEIVFKNPTHRRIKKRVKRKNTEKEIELSSNFLLQSSKNSNVTLVNSQTSKLQCLDKNSNNNLEENPIKIDNIEDAQQKCIERIFSKHEKLKSFLMKLLLRRKASREKNNAIVPVEMSVSTENRHDESDVTGMNCIDNTSVKCIYTKATTESKCVQVTTESETKYVQTNQKSLSKPVQITNHKTIEETSQTTSLTEFLERIQNMPSKIEKHPLLECKKNADKLSKIKKPSLLGCDKNVEQCCNSKNILPIFNNHFFEEKYSETDESIRLNKDRKCPTTESSSDSMEKLIKIRYLNKHSKNKFTLQTIQYMSSINHITISSKVRLNKHPFLKKKMPPERLRVSYRNDLFGPPCSREKMDFRKDGCHVSGDIQNSDYHLKLPSQKKFLYKNERKIMEWDGMPSQIYSRVSNWISTNDFFYQDNTKSETDAGSLLSNSKITDLTSVSKMDKCTDIIVEERTDIVNFSDSKPSKTSEENFTEKLKNINSKTVRTLSKFSQYSPFQCCGNLKSNSAPPVQFSVIVEGEETELPPGSAKMSEVSFKTIKTSNMQPQILTQPSRPLSRHKHKHSEAISQKPDSIDRKPRKKRTMDKVGISVEERQKMLEEIAANRVERLNKRRYQRKLQTEQFLKSMQMLQANAKADSQPFEDYSIFLYRQTAPKFEDRVKDLEKQFTYIPDYESRPSQISRIGGRDEDIASKIKHLETKWTQPQQVEKKPKDLMRAIGKIERSDWNIKEIEKKIMENKQGKPSKSFDKEKVPKWSKEQFVARQTKMEKQHYDRQNSAEAKFAEIDRSIKNLDQKLKEGTVRELRQNKVASITEKLVKNVPAEAKLPEKHPIRQPMALQTASEYCHFCKKRVYLMERLSAEGRFFHHGCFKCQYCHVQLRLGSYAFDRDGMHGYKFFCLQHFGMVGETQPTKVIRKLSVKRHSEYRKHQEKKPLPGITGVDLLDKVQTPERIEFSNLSTGHISSDQEDSLNQMDEDEWTDKNFGGSCAELDDTDDDSSSISDTDSDDEDMYDDALEEPVTKEGTLKWAERWKNSYSKRKTNPDSDGYSSSDQSSYYDSSDDEESDTATEGEEEVRARELRKQEVCVVPPMVHTDTGTDTEIVSDETSSESSSEIHNSATEISTDSEFAQDDPTPTRELPSILLNDFHVTKTRGSSGIAKKFQVKSRYLQRPSDGKTKKSNIELKLTPLVPPAQTVKKPAPIAVSRPEGYVLNRTQSTGGIAAKVSLELKKKYLLGETSPGSIQKSGSASTLDVKFKSFHTNISDCQKMLKPTPEISASMQTFCKKLNELESPVVSPQPSSIFTKEIIQPAATAEENCKSNTDEATEPPVFENEPEGRPRSPLHETSIIVPQIDWNKKNESLTSDSLASSESEDEKNSKPFANIPKVEISAAYDNEEFVPDSLIGLNETQSNQQTENVAPKSIASEKKALNQPKTLPNLENMLPEIHNSLHIKYKSVDAVPKETPDLMVHSSGLSSPESGAEQVTTALTETELSDWARDEVVSDDFEDGEFEIHFTNSEMPSNEIPAKMAGLSEFDEPLFKKKTDGSLTEARNDILKLDLDNIEFMDTGTETSSDDGIANSQNGYVLLKNDDDFAEDSLNPHINDILEATNIHVLSNNIEDSITADLTNLEPEDQPKQTTLINDHDDSTVIIESGTTTEENTFTDSTVKNVNDFNKEAEIVAVNNNFNANENEDPETPVADDSKAIEEKQNTIENNVEFHQHCQRLKSKVEFSNAKDSIDVRKSRRKSKTELLKPDLIAEEVTNSIESPVNVSLNLVPNPHTPDILYNREVIKKERDTNQKLIQEMVMNKMKAENKSLERRKRNKSSPSNVFTKMRPNNLDQNISGTLHSVVHTTYTQPDVLSTIDYPFKNLETVNTNFIESEAAYSVPIKNANNQVETPKAPPRTNRSSEDMNKKLEKLKQTVRLRNKENEHLLLNKDKISSQKPLRRCVSGNYDLVLVPKVPQQESLSQRAQSVSDFPQKLYTVRQSNVEPGRAKVYQSDPNIVDLNGSKSKRKSQDRENRKSLTKFITGLFSKKSPTSGASKGGLFSKLSPKSKETSKNPEVYYRRKCLSESFVDRNITPPPVPPLPINYVRKTDDSSEGEEELKKQYDSYDTLDITGASVGSSTGRRSSRSRRSSRQAQLKRHRMAQEIQRKLEETEVKMKELEDRGVLVEKTLRGEGGEEFCNEPELLQEWFDLMRDRTELRRYEKELTVRAQELELEDRHARLQHELRERIEDSKPKTKEDLDIEESIINEMIKIVEKRDWLLTEIEEDRLRYAHQDRDFEEQMLAKGLRTSVEKSPDH